MGRKAYPFDFGQDLGAGVNETVGITNGKPRILLTDATTSLAKIERITVLVTRREHLCL